MSSNTTLRRCPNCEKRTPHISRGVYCGDYQHLDEYELRQCTRCGAVVDGLPRWETIVRFAFLPPTKDWKPLKGNVTN